MDWMISFTSLFVNIKQPTLLQLHRQGTYWLGLLVSMRERGVYTTENSGVNGLTEEWQRVVCAHELAHDCMHPGISQFWMDKHTFFNIGKFERQANTFALKILTYGKPSEQCESMEHYLISCGIPQELHHLYEL